MEIRAREWVGPLAPGSFRGGVMRTLHVSPRVTAPLAAFVILACTIPGCSDAPMAPASGHGASALRAGLARSDGPVGVQEANLFYPLGLGNHWGYDHALSIEVVPDDGPPEPTFGVNDRRVRDLVCIEPLGERSYVVERESYPGGVFTWVRYRQDEAGLFEADLDITLPPTCAGVAGTRVIDARTRVAGRGEEAWEAVAVKIADPAQRLAYRAAWESVQARSAALWRALCVEPGMPRSAAGGSGATPDEITRLEYPLHPGAHWVIRADPRVETTVEAAEALELPAGRLPGWRTRIESDFLGPSDHAHLWFGRSGLLKIVAHVEGVATDPSGNPYGRVISDASELVTAPSL